MEVESFFLVAFLCMAAAAFGFPQVWSEIPKFFQLLKSWGRGRDYKKLGKTAYIRPLFQYPPMHLTKSCDVATDFCRKGILRYCTVFQATRSPCSSALFRLHSFLSLEAIKCTALFSTCFHRLLRYYGCVGLPAIHLDS